MNNFGLNYEIRVQANDGGADIIIKPPFTIEFNVMRNRYSSAALSEIRIYNLSENNRAQLRKNQVGADVGVQKKIVFKAGYGTDLATILIGNVQWGYSIRTGTEYITTLQAFDGGFAYTSAEVEKEYKEGTPYRNIIADLLKTLKPYGIAVGSIGVDKRIASRGLSVSGPTIRNLKELTNNLFFIDNSTAHVLKPTECVPAPLRVLSSASGLLGTPFKEREYVDIELLFEPKLRCAQILELDSSTGKNFNGIYTIISMGHSGIISEAVPSKVTTKLSLAFGQGTYTEIPGNF